MKRRVVLTDVDNTLFSWIDYFGSCFRALVHAVAREGKFAEDELYDSFQLVFQNEGTVEYKRAIQENLLIKQMEPEQRHRLAYIGWIAFSQAQKRHLRPYPNVIPTLRHLRNDGVYIVAVTNSGGLQAIHRLRQLGLGKLLDGLIAWDHDVAGGVETGGDYHAKVHARLARSGLPWAITLPHDKLKPNVEAYRRALSHLGAASPSIWIIGDSLEKDLSPASELGAKSVWARYGHQFEEKNFRTLVRITHWSPERIRATYDTSVLTPDYVAEDFSALLNIVGQQQTALF